MPGDERLPLQLAISRRNDSTRIEKREAESQLALKRWVSKVDTWPSTWRCKHELDGCASVGESLELVGDDFSGKAPSISIERGNSTIFFAQYVSQSGLFLAFVGKRLLPPGEDYQTSWQLNKPT